MVTVPSLQIIYASTSGHTEYIVGLIADALKGARKVTVTRVERATPASLYEGDVLLLACGTWNTGGIEGQFNPHMHTFLLEKAKGEDLKGKNVAIVGLGDARYRYTARAGELLQRWVEEHGGTLVLEPLIVVNEPYGQEDEVNAWAKKLSALIS